MTIVLVNGAGSFVGGRLVRCLSGVGFRVRGIDLTLQEFSDSLGGLFIFGDLSDTVVAPGAELVTASRLAEMVMTIAGGRRRIRHVSGPPGVRSGNSDNRLIHATPGWFSTRPVKEGLRNTCRWVETRATIGDYPSGAGRTGGKEYAPTDAR